jgi:hypothetical protein
MVWPPTFMVRSCTVFPLGVWMEIDVFACEVIGLNEVSGALRFDGRAPDVPATS